MVDYRADYIGCLNQYCGKPVKKVRVLEKDTQGNPIRVEYYDEVIFKDKITKTTSKVNILKAWNKVQNYYLTNLFVKAKKEIREEVIKELRNKLGREPNEGEFVPAFQEAVDDPDMDKRSPIYRRVYENFKIASDASILLSGSERDTYLNDFENTFECAFCYGAKGRTITKHNVIRKEGFFLNFCSNECCNEHHRRLNEKYKASKCYECGKDINDAPRSLNIKEASEKKSCCSWPCLHENLKKRRITHAKCSRCPKIRIYITKRYGEELEEGWVKKNTQYYCSIDEYGGKRIEDLTNKIEQLPGWRALDPTRQRKFIVEEVNILLPGMEQLDPDGRKYTPPRYWYKEKNEWWEISPEKEQEVLAKARNLTGNKKDNKTDDLNEERQRFIEQLELTNGWNLLSSDVKKSFIQRAKVASGKPDFNAIRIEVNDAIAAAKKNGGGPNQDQAKRDAAIAEIRQALTDNKTICGFSDDFVNGSNTTWIKEINSANGGNIQKIKEQRLNGIYRMAARKEIENKLAAKSLSVSILGVGATSEELKKHFKSFVGQSAIETRRDHLLGLIDDYGKNKDQEIAAAIQEVKGALKNAGLEGQTTKIETIIGKDWENNFKGLKDDVKIKEVKDKLIQLIKDYVVQDKTMVTAAIAEIEKFLRESNLSDSILGDSNWRAGFEGKNQTEINKEVERLRKLIMAENDKKGNQGGTENKEILKQTQTTAINQVRTELKKGHQKLAVEESELPVQLFAPYQTLTEKVNSLDKTEDITNFNNKLLEVIEQKKKEKLTVIANNAIAEIEKEIGQLTIELGENKDFVKKLKTMTDPDVIEITKKNILDLIKEQKQAAIKNIEENLGNSDSKQKPKPSLGKVIGITALIVLPVMMVGFIVLRVRQKGLGRKQFS